MNGMKMNEFNFIIVWIANDNKKIIKINLVWIKRII